MCFTKIMHCAKSKQLLIFYIPLNVSMHGGPCTHGEKCSIDHGVETKGLTGLTSPPSMQVKEHFRFLSTLRTAPLLLKLPV